MGQNNDQTQIMRKIKFCSYFKFSCSCRDKPVILWTLDRQQKNIFTFLKIICIFGYACDLPVFQTKWPNLLVSKFLDLHICCYCVAVAFTCLPFVLPDSLLSSECDFNYPLTGLLFLTNFRQSFPIFNLGHLTF